METSERESRICEELCKVYAVDTLKELFDAIHDRHGIGHYKKLRAELFGQRFEVASCHNCGASINVSGAVFPSVYDLATLKKAVKCCRNPNIWWGKNGHYPRAILNDD